MLSSQKRDGLFSFNMHANPMLSKIVDSDWRKDSFKNINIFIPDSAKQLVNLDQNEQNEPFFKFPVEKSKEWADIGIYDVLGKFADIKEIDKKEKVYKY